MVIRLALPPAAAVLIDVETSSTSKLRQGFDIAFDLGRGCRQRLCKMSLEGRQSYLAN